MEITSKQRAKLRGMAQNIETIAQFGKNELSPEQIVMVEQMLTKRELIKCSVLENSPYTARELVTCLPRRPAQSPLTPSAESLCSTAETRKSR